MPVSERLSVPATSARSNDGRALAAAFVTVTLWASAFVGIRSGGEDLSAGPLTLLRLAIGSVGLGVLVLALARREPLPTKRDIPGLLVFGASLPPPEPKREPWLDVREFHLQ